MIEERIKQIGKPKRNRIKNAQDSSGFQWKQKGRGLVSVHANWSAYSVNCLDAILKTYRQAEKLDFDHYILDIDSFPLEKQIDLFGGPCHGYFETVWIENGEVVHNFQIDKRDENIKRLVAYLKEEMS